MQLPRPHILGSLCYLTQYNPVVYIKVMTTITNMKAYRDRKAEEYATRWNEEMALAEECTLKLDFNGSKKHIEAAKVIRAEMLKLSGKEPKRTRPETTSTNTWGIPSKPHITYTSHIDMGNSKAFDPPESA